MEYALSFYMRCLRDRISEYRYFRESNSETLQDIVTNHMHYNRWYGYVGEPTFSVISRYYNIFSKGVYPVRRLPPLHYLPKFARASLKDLVEQTLEDIETNTPLSCRK